MKKIVAIYFTVFCFFTISYAQDNFTSLGLRAGFANGITLKHFTAEKLAFEGILTNWKRGHELAGLYEIHNRIFTGKKLHWYIGLGAHLAFWDGDYERWGKLGTSYTVIGVDGIVGVEYTFDDIPINIGINWKPAYNVIGYPGYWGDSGAFSVRYIF